MSLFRIGEVIETKKAFKTGQKDDENNSLFFGSIQVRIGYDSHHLGQVRNVWAAPASFNRRIPLIGEQVLLFTGPGTENSAASFKGLRWFYMCSYNAVDDITLHHFPKQWQREAKPGGGTEQRGLADKEEVGYTISKNVGKSAKPLQPFEGDDLWEGRFGQSIRFTSNFKTVNPPGEGIYEKKPTWKGQGKHSPLMMLRVKSPEGGRSYDVEDLKKDDSSIYLTSKHTLQNLKPGFQKNKIAAKIGSWSKGPQIVLDSDRIVLNGKKDRVVIVGKEQTVTTAKKVLMQSKRYKVDLDDLMDYIDDLTKQVWRLVTAQATFTTFSGPTGIATNMSDVTKIHKSDFTTKFKTP